MCVSTVLLYIWKLSTISCMKVGNTKYRGRCDGALIWLMTGYWHWSQKLLWAVVRASQAGSETSLIMWAVQAHPSLLPHNIFACGSSHSALEKPSNCILPCGFLHHWEVGNLAWAFLHSHWLPTCGDDFLGIEKIFLEL